jgi:myo-inositol-1(or 4)-monophosphatase
MTRSADPHNLLATAVRLATLGGQMAAARLGMAQTRRKADRTFVTQVDGEIQEALLRTLADEYPDHSVLAEEEQSHAGRHASVSTAEFCWVIDPLDGTRNFSRAMPIFGTSVAVLKDGMPLAGAIGDAMSGQVFSALAGEGATLNGRPIHVRDDPPGSDTMIAVRGRSGHPAPPAIHHWADRYVLRNVGAAALHLAFVAAGMMDATFHAECKLWDLAAGALLVTEAGGVVTDPAGKPLFPCHPRDYHDDDMAFLAAGPTLHRHLVPDLSGA